MKKVVAILTAISAFAVAAPKCNLDKAMRNFEKRMDMNMSGSKVTKNITSDPEGVSVVQKLSKPIKSGQYMGLRQYLVYGFIGCELKDVRMGKLSKDSEIVAEATMHLRSDGNLKASCKGSGDVMRANPFTYSMEPNPECICYDENSIEKKPGRKTGCAEVEDFDGNRLVIPSRALDLVDPFEKRVDNSGFSVQVVERDCYFHESDTGARKAKKVLSVVSKALKKIAKSVDSVEGEEKDGNVTLKLKIAADGSVSSASVVSATVFNEDAKRAVSDAVKGLDFGNAGGESVFFLVLKLVK